MRGAVGNNSTGANVSADAYRCVCASGFANGMCNLTGTGSLQSQYEEECSVLESKASQILDGNCDIDINECVSSPCQNGADCSESATNMSTGNYRLTVKDPDTGLVPWQVEKVPLRDRSARAEHEKKYSTNMFDHTR